MSLTLEVIFKPVTRRFLFSLLFLLFYALGHCSIIVGAGIRTEVVERYLN